MPGCAYQRIQCPSTSLGSWTTELLVSLVTAGGLLAAPVTVSRLLLSNGERAEILLDLNGPRATPLQLMSFATEYRPPFRRHMSAGMGVPGLPERVDFPLLKTARPGTRNRRRTSIPATLVP